MFPLKVYAGVLLLLGNWFVPAVLWRLKASSYWMVLDEFGEPLITWRLSLVLVVLSLVAVSLVLWGATQADRMELKA